MTLVRYDCQFTVSFPTSNNKDTLRALFICQMKRQECIFFSTKNIWGWFFPPHVRYLFFCPQSYVTHSDKSKETWTKLSNNILSHRKCQCGERQIQNVIVMWKLCDVKSLLACWTIKKKMEKRVCRNRFLLVCTIKGLREGSETGGRVEREDY